MLIVFLTFSVAATIRQILLHVYLQRKNCFEHILEIYVFLISFYF